MRYLIAYLIKGEAAFYHKNLSNELANVFGMNPVSQRIPPHITLKSPFDARGVGDIDKLLKKFSETHTAVPLALEGFGHFDHRVVYMDVRASQEAVRLISELAYELRRVPWLKLDQYDDHNNHIKRLHATLAYAETRTLFKELMDYLKDEKGRFDIMLDNIAILEREKDVWRLHSEYALRPKEENGQQDESVRQEANPVTYTEQA